MTSTTSPSSLELLYRISREFASALDLHTVLQRVLFQSLKYVGGERASIVVMDDQGKAIDAAIVFGTRIQKSATYSLRETIERGLAGWVVRNRQPALVPDTSKDERWVQRPDDAADRSGAKAALCVPLVTRDQLVGVLTLVHPEPGAFKEEHLSLVQAIADQAAIAVLNARLYAESQRQARVMTSLAASASALNAALGVQEVLQRILDDTMRALQVETVALALLEDGDLVFQAVTGLGKEHILHKRAPARSGIFGRVVQEAQGTILPSISDEKTLAETHPFEGLEIRALAIAPIFAQNKVIGILEAINPLAKTFDTDALLVLAGIGNLAGSALQHAQLFERLQAAHKRYRELFDDNVDPIFVTDLEGNIYEANRQASILSGYTSQELIGKKILQLHTPRNAQVEMPVALKAGQTVSYEANLNAKDGHSIPIQVYVRQVFFDDTQALQWLMRDITERKELDKLREDMTAMIYHDLRSPLANIVSSLELLRALGAQQENETMETVLNIAQRSTDRIQRLLNSLLDISRLEAGQPIANRRSVSPTALIQDAVEAVQPTTNNRHQTLTVHIPDHLPEVFVDEDMMRRVLINLLENASKFTPPEGQIAIGAEERPGEVLFWVQDNGPGISAADQQRIFQKFARLTGKDGPGGLGLGLAFCRLAVLGHGGRIWVESEEGHGAKFFFAIPLQQ
ncbi:MAG: GAF domain-containing protein [Anaerolineales bacterium]|nr:GAF domain-containing protein [Anaerolineales bacterium]MCX7609871.1 GAF domain-containing protein [Anaerolineales bacterium]MDW8227159.1 GAF domain-containing protein [Anaerolineales bacterium]MDW8447010.1 GAF domain-containing protein [Anaerolineales bacterium]